MTEKIEKFLEGLGFEDYELHEMTPGASFRSYFRVLSTQGRFVLMDVPTDRPLEDGQSAASGVIEPFLRLTDYLSFEGVRVPRVYDQDIENGFILLEDLGDKTFYQAFHTKTVEKEWYKSAVDVLVHLALKETPQELPRVDEKLIQLRGQYFLDDYVPMVTGYSAKPKDYKEMEAAINELYASFTKVPWAMCLWDFHSPNLIQTSVMPSMDKVAVLDYQDAKVGPLTYDLACLLYDARLTISDEIREDLLEYFIGEMPDSMDRNEIIVSFAIAGIMRNLGVLGRLARAVRRDGRSEFLPYLKIVWSYLEEGMSLKQAKSLGVLINRLMTEDRQLDIPK